MITADARIDLLVDPSSPAFLDQARVGRLFGADPVVVLVEPAGNGQLLSPDHMLGLARLEGELAREPGVRRVYGPGTLINTLATEVTRISGRARSAAAESGMRDLRFVPSGGPALTASLADAVLSSLVWLIPLALIAIVVVALAAARALAVLPLAALASLWTAGLAGLLPPPITPATLAVIPVGIGRAHVRTPVTIQTPMTAS